MDPYQYLFKKLDIQIINNIDHAYDMPYCELWFKKEIVDVFGPKTTAKDMLQYYNGDKDRADKLSKILREYRYKGPASELIKILRQFPAELKSKEHVDLLLTLNGINKEA